MELTVQDAVDRKSEQSFQDSLERLESFYEEAADKKEGDAEAPLEKIEDRLDWYDEIDEAEFEDLTEEFEGFEALALEAADLKERVEELAADNEDINRSKVDSIINKLDQAVERGNKNRLRTAVEEAFEEIMDLEMED